MGVARDCKSAELKGWSDRIAECSDRNGVNPLREYSGNLSAIAFSVNVMRDSDWEKQVNFVE